MAGSPAASIRPSQLAGQGGNLAIEHRDWMAKRLAGRPVPEPHLAITAARNQGWAVGGRDLRNPPRVGVDGLTLGLQRRRVPNGANLSWLCPPQSETGRRGCRTSRPPLPHARRRTARGAASWPRPRSVASRRHRPVASANSRSAMAPWMYVEEDSPLPTESQRTSPRRHGPRAAVRGAGT